MLLRILNWEKYQARKEIQNPWWFKFNNSFFEDDKIQQLTIEAKLLFVYCLCAASKAKKEIVYINEQYLDVFLNIKKTLIKSTVAQLVHTKCAEYAHEMGTREEEKREEENRKEEKKEENAQQVERLYQEFYPRKEGKTRGLKKLIKEIRTPEDLANLEKAIKNYSHHTGDVEKKYIKHFSTFAEEWKDWIETENKSQFKKVPIK